MRILAIETSSLVASAAILEDDIVIAEYSVNYKKTHSQTLLPMIDEIFQQVEMDVSEMEAVAVAKGPGSFTGLRIGSATAKGLAQALDIPIIPVPTMAAMAYRFYGSEHLVCPIMDARRHQVYTGFYTFKEGNLVTVMEQCPLDVKELAEKCNTQAKTVIFTGDGIPPYRKDLEELLTVPYLFAPAHCSRQSAAAVGALGYALYGQGIIEKAEEHVPDYLRVSQAERERAERLKQEHV